MGQSEPTSLAESFSDLARLRFGSQSSGAVLGSILGVAANVVQGVDTASITVRATTGYRTLKAQDEQALSLDEAQYHSNLGPCLEAIREDRQVHSANLSRWPAFARRAQECGVHEVLSTPVPIAPGDRACLNLYSLSSAFTEEAATVASILAEHLGAVIGNVLTFDQATSLNSELQRALESRELVGLAKGILMERENCGENQALKILVAISQSTNRKLRDVAETLASQRTKQ